MKMFRLVSICIRIQEMFEDTKGG